MSQTTVFSIEGDIWTPELAAGGFNGPGMHGGAVGAMLTGACELKARELDPNPANPFLPLSVSVFLLRPVPRRANQVTVEVLRLGGRGLFLRAEARTDGKLQASAQAAFARAEPTPGMPEPDFAPLAPETGKPGRLTSPGHPWLGDVAEMRFTEDSLCWYRYDRPLFPGETPMALAASVADWSSGTWRPDGWREPKAKWFPNVELGVRLARPPQGPWIGFRNRQHWRQNGLGTTETELFDRHGAFGAASQCVVLTPLDGPGDRALGFPPRAG
ncbi:MAG: thioesterase family protein [Alphaproteobacteria bacterium]|nr:thioesterase family protein [Alphaproteobacteria bacterium]MCB9931455.1 thioesterase family protein [Alphaproteobacteria bacterium]